MRSKSDLMLSRRWKKKMHVETSTWQCWNERKCWIRNHWVSVMKHGVFVLFILINEHHRNGTLEIYAYFLSPENKKRPSYTKMTGNRCRHMVQKNYKRKTTAKFSPTKMTNSKTFPRFICIFFHRQNRVPEPECQLLWIMEDLKPGTLMSKCLTVPRPELAPLCLFK